MPRVEQLWVHCCSGQAYVGMEDLLAIDSCHPSHPVRLLRTTEQVNTPLDWQALVRALAEHPDPRLQRYIIEGIRMASGSGLTTRWKCVAPQ